MTQMYDYGFFIDENHINNFTNFLTQIYDDNDRTSWSYIPGNEIAYLYAVSALLNETINDPVNTIKDVINIIDNQSRYFDFEDSLVHKLATNSLMKQINVDMSRAYPEDYSVVIKTMVDLLTNEYDLVMDKKFEMISYVRHQMDRSRERITENSNEYGLER